MNPERVRPRAVRVLTGLLVATALTTVVVEVLNWRYAEDAGFALAVRTGWALLRSVGFLVLVWHVRHGRVGARPFGLILAVTTVFAVGRLVVPRSGLPTAPAVFGFAVLLALCTAVVLMLYRSPAIGGHLTRHPGRLVLDRSGIAWRQGPPPRTMPARHLTARVATFTYSPLMLVPALISIGEVVDGRVEALPVVVFWLAAAFVTSYAVLLGALFLKRGSDGARLWLIGVTVAVLLIDLPLCWWLLGVDGLVRDGAPLVAAAGLALSGLGPKARTSPPAALVADSSPSAANR